MRERKRRHGPRVCKLARTFGSSAHSPRRRICYVRPSLAGTWTHVVMAAMRFYGPYDYTVHTRRRRSHVGTHITRRRLMPGFFFFFFFHRVASSDLLMACREDRYRGTMRVVPGAKKKTRSLKIVFSPAALIRSSPIQHVIIYYFIATVARARAFNSPLSVAQYICTASSSSGLRRGA